MSKVYTNRSNCARAAKVALGKDAKPGQDFTISGTGKEWHWARKDAPAKTKRTRNPSGTLAEQPKMAKLIKLTERKHGVSVEEAMEIMGWVSHSVRGAFSHLRDEKVPLFTKRFGRTVRYFSEPQPEATSEEASA